MTLLPLLDKSLRLENGAVGVQVLHFNFCFGVARHILSESDVGFDARTMRPA
jgi:hypothetical protein